MSKELKFESELANTIKTLMDKKDISIAELSKRTGQTPESLRDAIIYKRRSISVRALRRIGKILGFEVEIKLA